MKNDYIAIDEFHILTRDRMNSAEGAGRPSEPASRPMESPRLRRTNSSIEGEKALRRAAERSLRAEQDLERQMAAEMAAVRFQLEALHHEAAGGPPLSMAALPRLDHSLEGPLSRLSISTSPRLSTQPQPQRRSEPRGVVDHSLMALAPPALAVDHSLAAPPGGLPWTLPQSISPPDEEQEWGDSPALVGVRRSVRSEPNFYSSVDSSALFISPAQHPLWQAGADTDRYTTADDEDEELLDLVVHTVDETFALPSLAPAQPYHGRTHELRNLSSLSTAGELIAQSTEGVPMLGRPGCSWCLCWGEEDEFTDLGKPGLRIEVFGEQIADRSVQLAQEFTLEEAGVESDDVLWCRYMMCT